MVVFRAHMVIFNDYYPRNKQKNTPKMSIQSFLVSVRLIIGYNCYYLSIPILSNDIRLPSTRA